jgi:hypothetical protein
MADVRQCRLPVQPGGPAGDDQAVWVNVFSDGLDSFDGGIREQG